MDGIAAFVLGLLQGITEFLPISSTGHLYLGRHFFGLDEAGLFLDTMLHFGTLIAIIVFYKEEWLAILRRPFGRKSLLIIVATIPAIVFGFLFKDFFDGLSKTGQTIGWEFLFTGGLLWLSESVKEGHRKIDDLTAWDALFIGCFQATAIFPAVSRSGATLAASLLRKVDRDTAAYFSFLISTPAVAGALVLQARELFRGTVEQITPIPLLIATLSSALFGYLAIQWMIDFVKRHSLRIFAVYVWVLGAAVLILQWTGVF
ncbi:undecaprenyl-diphosphate phosphatase [Caenibacillus caldisaponilyticus]|uniref:undecaprenyl-diphosphate phosphatase n=1 Tax=Caenibacillus caldisaponilyticus TaxID=1674942 RepID=UPI00187619CC|nr:undecaprenyl-diphosphate phosphatase [Caenibacillus caldisaponilyticus]